jgi:hypothetical protein
VAKLAPRPSLEAQSTFIKNRLLAVPVALADRAADAALRGGAQAAAWIYDAEIRAMLTALAGAEAVPAKGR